MANKLLKPCKHPRCPTLTYDSYCDKHKQARDHSYDKHRGTAHQRGYNSRWSRYRLAFLKKHPLCVKCEQGNRLTPATVVDHIIPHKGDKTLFWDTKNHQPLCKRCHDIKTAKEDGGFGNRGRGY